MLTKKITTTSLLILLSLGAIAQRPWFKDKQVAARVGEHVQYLSSAKLEGRLTTTPGAKLSADYIASHFEKTGLKPRGDVGFFQYIGVPNLRMAQPLTSLILESDTLKLFTNFFPMNISANNGRYTGEAINVHHGIEDPGLNQNDYENKNVRGKVVLIDIDLPKGSSTNKRYTVWKDPEMRANYAISRGASAVLFYTNVNALIPSGKLEKTLKNVGKPVLFVHRDLSTATTLSLELNLDILMLSKPAYNIVGMVDNTAKHTVFLVAHHDHLGTGTSPNTPAEYANILHPGADNNASGVAALLELAREITKKPKKYSTYNYVFVALTGSEQNNLGAEFFVESTAFYTEPNAVINLDMIGHLDSNKKEIFIQGTTSALGWENILAATKIWKRKIKKVNTSDSSEEPNDFAMFYNKGAPSINITTGKQPYTNTPSDTPDKINYGGEAFIIRYLTKVLRNIDKNTILNLRVELLPETQK